MTSSCTGEKYGTVLLGEALLEIGVFALNRKKRDELAASLAADGVSQQDLHNLRDYLFACIDTTVATAKAQRVLAAKLLQPIGRKEMFADLAIHLASKKPVADAPAVASGKDHDYGQAIRKRDMEQTRRLFEAPATDRPLLPLIEAWKKKAAKA